jgi:hypothetical protein
MENSGAWGGGIVLLRNTTAQARFELIAKELRTDENHRI